MKKIKNLILLIAIFGSISFSVNTVFADISLITGTKSGISNISDAEVKSIYLGNQTYIGDIEIKPVHLITDDHIYNYFVKNVLDLTPRQYRVKWMKNIFSEGIAAPEEKRSVLSIISFVKNNKGSLGYLDSKDVPGKKGIVVLKVYPKK